MIELIEKNVQKVQLKTISIEFICKYYEDTNRYDTVLLLYDENKYITNVAYEELCKYSDEKELKYFLEYRCREKSVNSSSNMVEQARLILDNNPYIVYVLVSGSINLGKALFYHSVMDVKKYQEVMGQCKDILMQKGICTYLVRIPDSQEIIEEKCHEEWQFGHFSAPINWSIERKKDMEHYLHNFTELGYEDARKSIMHKESCSIYGDLEEKTIFIVGPCIVGGWDNLKGESLSAILYEQLKQVGLQYKIQQVIVPESADTKLNAILEFDIRQNDIVIWITSCIDKDVADLDLTNSYNLYGGDKWLYADVPIHTTKTGNEMIVYELIRNIIKPAVNRIDESDNKTILHTGEKQLTCREQDELRLYIEQIKKNDSIHHGIIGACVVTCNPFTKGHYHLIKFASEQVDFLYVFVVEDDDFFVPFSDRIEMVRKGISKLDNVIVLPSGSFMISRKTFKNYFEKEIQQDVIIDAAKDVMIFKNYIAPALMITKRFVGEEPEDYITAQYNQLLKEKLEGGGRCYRNTSYKRSR